MEIVVRHTQSFEVKGTSDVYLTAVLCGDRPGAVSKTGWKKPKRWHKSVCVFVGLEHLNINVC